MNFCCWPLAAGYIPTADRRFRGTAEMRSLVPEVGGDALDPNRTSTGFEFFEPGEAGTGTNPSAQTLALCSLARTPNKPHRQI